MPAYVLTLWEESLAPWSDDPTEIDFYSDHNEETMAPFGGRYLRLSEHPLELLEGATAGPWRGTRRVPEHGAGSRLVRLRGVRAAEGMAYGPRPLHPRPATGAAGRGHTAQHGLGSGRAGPCPAATSRCLAGGGIDGI